MSDYILAIDQGTTGTGCLLLKLEAQGISVAGSADCEFPQHFPKPGWVEHDLNEIWQTVEKSVRAVLGESGIDPRHIRAIGITNQRETVGFWDYKGVPQGRAIVWQDRRSADNCERLKNAGHAAFIKQRTGLVLDPYFSATKIAWVLAHDTALAAKARKREVICGTMDSWLCWNLSGGALHITDVSNASRTMLCDIHKITWDSELCALLGHIPETLLPRIVSSAEIYGHTKGLSFLPDGIPIAGMAGDQQAALFGQACFAPGMAKCTYGTGAFALVNTGTRAVHNDGGILTTIAWRLGKETTYAVEGSTFVAGAMVQWLRDGLGIIEKSSDIETLALQVGDSDGVVVVPALTGLAAPHWRPAARGLISGLSRGTKAAHIARAALEGIALQIYDLFDAMCKSSGTALWVLRVDGGAAANNLLMQFQSDVLNVTIHRPRMLESTALGAGYLAALGVGAKSSLQDIANSWQLDREFQPAMPAPEVARRVNEWQKAVAKA